MKAEKLCGREAAFTMVEALVSITLTAFLAVSVGVLLVSSMRTSGRLGAASKARIDLLQAMRCIESDLVLVRRLPTASTESVSVRDIGDGQKVLTLTLTTAGFLPNRIEYRTETGPDGERLVRAEYRIGAPRSGEPEVVLGEVAAFEAEILTDRTEGEEANMPPAVRVRLTLSPAARTGGGEISHEEILGI